MYRHRNILTIFLGILILVLHSSCVENTAKSNIKVILLGERHGVKEHQLEIAKFIAAQTKDKESVAIVMEMIDTDQEKLVKAFAILSPNSLDDFEYAIEWDKAGWPDFLLYKPIFEEIWKHKFPIFAGDVSETDKIRWRRGRWFDEELEPNSVRRHIKWHRFWPGLRETLLISLVDIKRQLCGIASVDV